MGKKDKKKGKGTEKTAAKTEKKQSNKLKKELAAKGETDIETIIAEIEKEDKKRQEVKIIQVEPPTKRINFTLVAHPERDELILFGGEFFNGQKMFLYNDLLYYNIPNNTWTILKAPGGPPPRCGHQMVTTSVSKGQLWLFGGEFASPTQTQFYHYRDLWVFHIATNSWEKLNAPNGPSARSGHRMVYLKKHLVVFGGFHDNLRDYKYFDDLYIFNIETYKWSKIEPSGNGPSPRSSVIMAPLADGKILIYGGYSKKKIKKDVDQGQAHGDSFLLVPDKNDTTFTKWKWVQTKLGGMRFSERSGMTIAVAPNDVAYSFGGVQDDDEEEDIKSTFLNESYILDLGSLSWKTLNISGKKDKENKSRRRKENNDETTEHLESEDTSKSEEQPSEIIPTVVSDDGIFTVTVGPETVTAGVSSLQLKSQNSDIFHPSPRMNCGLVVKRGILYLYGGMFEDGNKQLTFSDFYSLDLRKLEEWKTIIANDQVQEWLDSESESESASSKSDDDDEKQSTDEEET